MSNRQWNRQGNGGMPAPPSADEPSLPGADEQPQLPGAEESSRLPQGVDPKPKLNDPKADSASLKTTKAPKKGIPVVAVRDGYYRMSRRAPGSEFMIADESELGSWMKLADPAAEKKRQDEARAKMLADRQRRQAEFEAKLAEKEKAGK